MTTTEQPELWQQAAAMAARAHRHQLRKDRRTPYVSHPVRVTLTVICVFKCTDPKVIAAALLHDTIEDCGVDYDDIHEQFGMEVADMVACMSKDMRMIEPEREQAYDDQLAAGSWQSRLIKLADTYDNLSDVTDSQIRRDCIVRARRALHLARNDEQLDSARAALEALVATAEKL